MPAKNIECQLAQGQIGRYLSGSEMSTESVTQLELHIAECEECSEHVEQKRRTLQEMAQQRKAAVFLPEPEEAPIATPAAQEGTGAQALIRAIQEKMSGPKGPVLEIKREPAAPRTSYWKALAFSGGLGVVLLGMSYITSNPTAVFGSRVEATASKPEPAPANTVPSQPERDPFEAQPSSAPASESAEPQPAEASSTSVPQTSNPEAPISGTPNKPMDQSNSASTSAAEAKPQSPANLKTNTPPSPKIQVRSRPVRRNGAVRARRARVPARSQAGIRVYDENGRPITGA